jgi:hypothetical protein
MCLLRYRRMPIDEYRLRYGDPGGEILPLFWLMGCITTLLASLLSGLVVAILARDIVGGLVAGIGGLILGVAAVSALAVWFPNVDARWLRLGPLAIVFNFATILIGVVIVVLVGFMVLTSGPPSLELGSGPDLWEVFKGVVRLVAFGSIVVAAWGFIASRFGSR